MTDVFKVFTALTTIFGSCGAVLNLLICILYFKNPQLLDAPNIFILINSAGDFLQSIMTTPLLVLSNARGKWLFGEAGCTIYAFITAFFGLSSMMHFAGIAYERYSTFCRFLDGNNETQFGKKRAIVLSILLWCYSFFWSLMPIIGWSNYSLEGIGTSCAVNWGSHEATHISFTFCLMLACYVLPVAIMVSSYYKTYKMYCQYSLQNNLNNTNVHAIREALEKERKMTWVTVALASGFLLAWTPYVISTIVAILKPNVMTELAASIPAYIAKSSFCYNPIIYAFVDKKMRRKLVDTFCCKSNQVNPLPISGSAGVVWPALPGI